MAEFPTAARVVIIGGGAVGASTLYHLARAGWTDSVLLERNELTAGSTWHAAGNVPTFSTSWSVMNMQRYSTELYARLGDEVDYPMNYHQTGSIRLAHSRERMQEFARAKGMGRHQGMDLEILGPEEIKARYPFIETHDLKGALYDPNDGDIDPAQLTQALAKGAREMGARVIRFCPATGVRRENGEWIIETAKGEIRCEVVVNAAGYYAQRVGEWFIPHGGRRVPMMVMSHQYLLSEEIPEIEAWTREQGHKLPLLRDVDVSYYLRQEKHGFNLGPYEPRCRAHWADPVRSHARGFQLSALAGGYRPRRGDRDRRDGAGAALGIGGDQQDHQRPDSLRPRRDAACLGRCRACRTRSRPASSPSGSRRAAAPARCWPNG